MSPSLRLLRAERGSERVDLAEGGCRGLAVQLARLREVGIPLVEVFRREQPRTLSDGRREDGCIHTEKATLVKEVVNGLLDLVSADGDRPLPRIAQPEVPVVDQQGDPLLLRLN